MIQLDQKYDREQFLSFLKEAFLKDFAKDARPVGIDNFKAIKKAHTLGSSSDLDLQVFEFEYSGSFNKRIALAKEAFQVMKQSATFQALAIFYSSENDDWRFSLMTANPQRTEKGSITVAYSNPRRYSFFLGPNAKTNTPTKFLIKKGMVVDFEDLKSRFSLEVVNKEFYKEIAECYTKLVGGTRGEGRNKKTYESILKLPSVNDHSQTSIEFAVRLIGRIIFCWFLREKISESGSSLMPKELLSLHAVSENTDYYHKILEPIFFEILNKNVKSRKSKFDDGYFSKIPYLNGGLFSPHDDDYFSYNEGKQAQNHNTVIVPDDWFNELFQILETYNFTIDENISIDEELSIDPEMLGRIFENLLAEINPETGESARKSTGSYYTPRVIVDYMVDESLLLYLKQKTNIEEDKLRAIISYDLSDDALYPLNESEKKSVVDAIEKVKILDPACGSGAFPIGALQKIVFILQQIDPNGQVWFQKQIQNTPPEIRRVIEREFSHENFDYIRKLGIIRENIYGIDIQPIATEIARLRCFLTLVVDERIDDALENRGIQPLPNLDFKFVTANSLIGLPKLSVQGELFDDNNKIDELKELRDRYFNAKDEERKDLMLAFSDLQSEMINSLIDRHSWTGVAKAELTRKLTEWKPFKHRSTDWFDPEWMFGIKNGFDIVIANPPYVDSEQMVKSEPEKREIYTQTFSTAKGNWDLFVIFIENGIRLLNDSSILTFIIPNKILSANYTKDLRKLLLTKSIQEIRDYSHVGVFIDQDIYPVTLVLENRKHINSDICRMTTMKNLDELHHTNEISAATLNSDIYWDRYFFDKKTLDLLLKIYERQKLSYTIKTIFSAATVSEAYEIKKFLADQEEGEGYKLINTGTIDRFVSLWGEKKTQYIKDSYIFPRILSSDLKKISINREFQASSPKVIIAGMSKEIEAFLDEKGEYLAGKSTSIILGDESTLIRIVGFLNSKLMSFFVTHFYHSLKMAGGYLNMEPGILANLPISPEELDSQIESSVVSLLSASTTEEKIKLTSELDKRVYDIYGLTDEEVKIVEGKND